MTPAGYEWRGVLAGAYANDKAMSRMVDHLVNIDTGAVLCKKIKPERMCDIGGGVTHCPECERRAETLSSKGTAPKRRGNVFRERIGDWRVKTFDPSGKKRIVAGFKTKEDASAYLRGETPTMTIKRSKPKRRTKKRKRAGRRRKLLGRVSKARARARKKRNAPKPVYAHERVYRPGDRVVAVNSIYQGAEGVVVRDIGTGIEWRITSNARVQHPEYAPVGQVVSTRKNYMNPA